MYERMLNQQIVPTYQDLCSYCGTTSAYFQSLNSFLTENFKTVQEIRFPYGKGYGWGVSHRKGKKLMCDIFAEADSFTLMIRLTTEQFNGIYEDVQEHTKELIDNKYPCGNGGWIHFRVTTMEDYEDAKHLLTVKCS